MDAEDVINLLDSYWFNQEIFKKKSTKPTSEIHQASPDRKIRDSSSKLKIPTQLTIHTRSKSDQQMSSKTSLNFDSFSPNSVLYTPLQPQTIPSGKEAMLGAAPRTPQSRKVEGHKKKIPNKGLSKSLSELEFEELKGFMDLGFVFSEEDRDSSLVEIIPGLQRLGKPKDSEEPKRRDARQSSIARPYLSEAWEVFDRIERENPLMNWRVPAVKNENDMKDSLKLWAHSVASAVR